MPDGISAPGGAVPVLVDLARASVIGRVDGPTVTIDLRGVPGVQVGSGPMVLAGRIGTAGRVPKRAGTIDYEAHLRR